MPARRLLRERRGNIGVLSAMVMPLALFSLGLGVDFASLTLEKRQLQSLADLTAIVAAADNAHAQEIVEAHFRANGIDLMIETENGVVGSDGLAVPGALNLSGRGTVSIVKGRYAPDETLAVGKRFVAGAMPFDAVQVTARRPGTLFFAAMFAKPPQLSAVGRASNAKLAAFSIGSRLASLDGGILNDILGRMLGTTVSLNVMDYRALIDANVDIQPFLKILSSDIHLTGATFEDVLDAEITAAQLFRALSATPGIGGVASAVLRTLSLSTGANHTTFKVLQILNIDPKNGLAVDTASRFAMRVNAFDMVRAAAGIANGSSQVALDLAASLPGIASATVALSIGEPPVTTPSHRLGAGGTAVRTAQTRLAVRLSVNGLSALLGLKIDLPLYVEVAYGEAKLTWITCHGGGPSNATVALDAVPGVAEVAMGNVDPSVLSNFSTDARVTPARILDAPLVRIDAVSHVEATNMAVSKLSFSPREIASGTVKTISTKDILTSTTQSLINNLAVEIKLPLITIVTPTIIQTALAQTLAAITPSIDTLLYNLLLVAGVRIGEADLRVTGVDCRQPVLVQ